MSMPEVLRIGGHWWRVEIVPDLRSPEGDLLDGRVDPATFTISICAGHPQQMRTTLWHELLHVAMPEMSEKVILALERATYPLFADNPALLPALVEYINACADRID